MSTANNLICVIPALNSAAKLPATLKSIAGVEVIIADGGSTDETLFVTEQFGARFLKSARGRGQQLGAGAEAAIAEGAEWLLFLHSDTVLSADWMADTQTFSDDPGNQKIAAVFNFRVDDQGRAARRLEKLVAWRTKALALPYGDQGLLISKDFYLSIGGYKTLELMEDVDLVRRIGGKRLRVLSATATTSAAKFQQAGYLRRSTRNLICLGLFFLGVPVRWITRIYS
jgi:rSAM/selenodomain-associated transferase 2